MTSCCPYDAERDLCIYRDELQLVIISVTGSAAGDGWVNTEELRIIQVPDRLNGVRILLRPLQPGDGAAVWPAVEESRADIARWEDWHERHQCPEDSEHEARRLGQEFAERNYLYFAIFRRSDDLFLGWVGLEEINWRIPSFSVGMWLRSSATGQGLMTEAVALLCRLCFRGFGARRVALLTESGNARSVALARRLGFVLEGEMRNDRLDINGQPANTLVFSLTPLEYRVWAAVG